jgi:hypothetical protein
LRPLARVALWLCLIAVPARAADQSREAKQYFHAGNQAYLSGQYQAAGLAYERAYELEPLAAISFSAAQAYRRQYHVDQDRRWLVRARELYRRYLAEQPSGGRRHHAVTHLATIDLLLSHTEASPDEPVSPPPTQLLVSSNTPEARAKVGSGSARPLPMVVEVTPGRHWVEVTASGHQPQRVRGLAIEGRLVVVPLDLTPLPAILSIQTEPGADVLIDARWMGTAPLAPLELPAGRHVIRLYKPGHHEARRVVMLRRGGHAKVVAPLDMTSRRTAAYATLAAAGVLALAGGASGGVALRHESEARGYRDKINSGRSLTPTERDAYGSATAARDDWRLASLLLLGGAAGAAIAGATLFVLEPSTELPPTTASGVRLRAHW